MTEVSYPSPPQAVVSDPRIARFGYLIVLLGSAAFVVGCFLPYFVFAGEELSLQWLVARPASPERVFAIRVGGNLFLFSGVAIIGALSIAGLLRESRSWIAVALSSASALWALSWIGGFLGPFGAPIDQHRSGYWLLLAGVGAVVIGTCLVVWGTCRNGDQGRMTDPDRPDRPDGTARTGSR